MKQSEQEFHTLLTEAVQEGLSSIGPSIPPVVFYIMQKDGSLEQNHRIGNIDAFEETLKKIFGFGAIVIEKKILEALYIRLKTPRKIRSNFKFVEEVKNARKLLDSSAWQEQELVT